MLVASAIALLDGLAGPYRSLIGLLAIPPVIVGDEAHRCPDGRDRAFCLVLALLSVLWHENADLTQYVVAVMTVAGDLAGLWVATSGSDRPRAGASELLAEASALMEDALDRRQRARHLVRSRGTRPRRVGDGRHARPGWLDRPGGGP
jgi:hypothetical protein